MRSVRHPKWICAPLLFCLSGLLFTGCTTAQKSTPNAEGLNGTFKLATGHDVSATEYRVDPPDTITVNSLTIKDINGASQTVRNDGKIVLPRIGEVKVSGLSPVEIDATINGLLEKDFVHPDVHVSVVANSKFYYVFGFGAGGPGRRPYTGNNTVLNTMADIQFSDGGWPQQVIISRPGQHGNPDSTVVVDFTKVQEHGNLAQNYVIENGDIVYIPLSPLASLARNIARFLTPVTSAGSVVSTGASVTAVGKVP